MILNCPTCQARFMVADALIPPAGRVVRCGKCANQWYVPHPDPKIAATFAALLAQEREAIAAHRVETPTDVEIKPLAEGANVPALKKRKLNPKPFMIAAPLIAACWLALAFVTYFPHWMASPTLAGIYQMIGVETSDGLIFSDVTMEREQEGSKTKFIISGSVRNHAGEARMVPNVRVTLKDKAGKPIWGREYPVTDATSGAAVSLKAGDIYPFRITNVETSFASSVASIVLDLGHPLELLMR